MALRIVLLSCLQPLEPKSVEITAGNTKYEIEAEVAPTTMNIQEITNGLVMDFGIGEENKQLFR